MAKTMQKIMSKPSRPLPPDQFRKPGQSFQDPEVVGQGTRFKALHKLYMQYVTDIMGSGELGALNETVAFNITKVQLTVNMKYLYVSWASSNIDPDEVAAVQDHLNRIAPVLRHELSSQRLVGHVPIIRFSQDEEQLALLKLEHVLRSADMGPDREAASPESLLAPQAMLPTVENPQAKAGGRPAEMRHDIMDLDHVHLMNLVKSTPRTRPEETSRRSPVGEYDTQTSRDFNLYLRKRKYDRKEAENKETPDTLKIKLELVNRDRVEEVDEDDWDYENYREDAERSHNKDT